MESGWARSAKFLGSLSAAPGMQLPYREKELWSFQLCLFRLELAVKTREGAPALCLPRGQLHAVLRGQGHIGEVRREQAAVQMSPTSSCSDFVVFLE